MKWLVTLLLIVSCGIKTTNSESTSSPSTETPIEVESRTCDTGFSQIKGKSSEFFCISIALQSAKPFWDAADYCASLDAKARLCSPTEFYTACKELSLTGTYQWVDDFSSGGAMIMGSSACSKWANFDPTGNQAFRCCHN